MSEPLKNPVYYAGGNVYAFPDPRSLSVPTERYVRLPIGNGELTYRVARDGVCLCQAMGDDAIAASMRFFGPPTRINSAGNPIWQLS